MADFEEQISQEGQDTEFDFSAAFKDAEEELTNDQSFDDVDEDTVAGSEEQSPDETQDTELDQTSEEQDTHTESDTDLNEVDYRAVYQRLANENRILKNQYEDLSSQYYSWRGRVEAENARQQEPKATAPEVKQEQSAELSELMELYPELIAPVQKLIDTRVSERVSAVEKTLQDLVKSKVEPIQEHVKSTEIQAHLAAINSAHPDYMNYVNDGSLEAWVNSLPSYHQIGAKYALSNGTAREVIQLFDAFKQSKNVAKSTGAATNSQKEVPSKIVNQVMGALSVPSGATQLPTDSTKEPADTAKLFQYYSRQLMSEGM